MRQAFYTLASLTGFQDPARPARKANDPFPVPFDYLQRAFRIDDRAIYGRDESFEPRLTAALGIGLPRGRESWLFRADPDAPFHKPIPEATDDLTEAFRSLAELKNPSPGISASPEVFYSAYRDWAGRMGLALGIKKQIFNRQQAGMEHTVFAMQGFFDGDNTFYIHKICRPNGYFGDGRVTGIQDEQWYQEDHVARDLGFAQDVAETIFNGDHPDVTAIWNRKFKAGGLRVPPPWAPAR